MTSPKDLRRSLLGAQLAGANTAAPPASPETPPQRVVAGAVGAVSKSLSRFEAELRSAQERSASGERIVEIDPDLVDPSFLRDRLDDDEAELDALAAAIREQGQQIPVLVRPHPDRAGRYQLAFGHRRLAACRRLGISVKAVIRSFGDADLLIAQGQENSARRNLSFIERAQFGRGMEERGYPRDVIMAALATDKTELSKLITVASAVPVDVIEAIGSAPKAGRTRWMALASQLGDRKALQRARDRIARSDFAGLGSDERFVRVFEAVKAAARPKARSAGQWATPDGRKLVRYQRIDSTFTLAIDEKKAPEFGEFVLSQLPLLFEAFKAR